MDVSEYILSFVEPDSKQLAAIDEQYETLDDLVPSIGPEVGKILGLILRTMNAKRIMEFGTCIGYSTIWLAEAMRATGGKLTAIELDERFYSMAKKNIEEAGLSEFVELIHGDAGKIVNEIEGPFDFILQDSKKTLYPEMLDRSIELLRVNGILAADDGLFLPKGFEKENAEPVHQYNEMVLSDLRLYSTILPIGDGLTLSVKLKD